MPPPAPPQPPSRLLPWVLSLLGLGVVSAVLLYLLPMNWMLISLILLLLGVAGLVLFHYAMWAYIGEPPEDNTPPIPPDRQGRRGPPHRNGSRRPGDPFYCK